MLVIGSATPLRNFTVDHKVPQSKGGSDARPRASARLALENRRIPWTMTRRYATHCGGSGFSEPPGRDRHRPSLAATS